MWLLDTSQCRDREHCLTMLSAVATGEDWVKCVTFLPPNFRLKTLSAQKNGKKMYVNVKIEIPVCVYVCL